MKYQKSEQRMRKNNPKNFYIKVKSWYDEYKQLPKTIEYMNFDGIVHGNNALNKQLPKFLQNETFDMDIYADKPLEEAQKGMNQLNKRYGDLFKVAEGNHKGTWRIIEKTFEKPIADFTGMPEKRIEYIVSNGKKYKSLKAIEEHIENTLKDPTAKYRHVKDAYTLRKIIEFRTKWKDISNAEFRSRPELIKKFGKYDDIDGDGKVNIKDCYPFDPLRQDVGVGGYSPTYNMNTAQRIEYQKNVNAQQEVARQNANIVEQNKQNQVQAENNYQKELTAYNTALKIAKDGSAESYIMQGSYSKRHNLMYPNDAQDRLKILKYINELTGLNRRDLTNKSLNAIKQQEVEKRIEELKLDRIIKNNPDSNLIENDKGKVTGIDTGKQSIALTNYQSKLLEDAKEKDIKTPTALINNGNTNVVSGIPISVENRNNSIINNSSDYSSGKKEGTEQRKQIYEKFLGFILDKDNEGTTRKIPESEIMIVENGQERPINWSDSTDTNLLNQMIVDEKALTSENTNKGKLSWFKQIWNDIKNNADLTEQDINALKAEGAIVAIGTGNWKEGATLGADLVNQRYGDWTEAPQRWLSSEKQDIMTGGKILTKEDKDYYKKYGQYSEEAQKKLQELTGVQKLGKNVGYATDMPTEFVQYAVENPYQTYVLDRAIGNVLPVASHIANKPLGWINPSIALKSENAVNWAVKAGLKYGIPATTYFSSLGEGYENDEAIARAIGSYATIKGIEFGYDKVAEIRAYNKMIEGAKAQGSVDNLYNTIKNGEHYKKFDAEQKNLFEEWHNKNTGKQVVDALKESWAEAKGKNYNAESEKIFLDHIAKTPEEKKILIELLKKYKLYVLGSSASGKVTASDLDLVTRKPLWAEIPVHIAGKTFNIKTPFYELGLSSPEVQGKGFFNELAEKGFDVKGTKDILIKNIDSGKTDLTIKSPNEFSTSTRINPEIKLGQEGNTKLKWYENLNPTKVKAEFSEKLTTGRKAETEVGGKKVEIHTQEWQMEHPAYEGYVYDKETGLYRVSKTEQIRRKAQGAYERGEERAKDIPDLIRLTKVNAENKGVLNEMKVELLNSGKAQIGKYGNINVNDAKIKSSYEQAVKEINKIDKYIEEEYKRNTEKYNIPKINNKYTGYKKSPNKYGNYEGYKTEMPYENYNAKEPYAKYENYKGNVPYQKYEGYKNNPPYAIYESKKGVPNKEEKGKGILPPTKKNEVVGYEPIIIDSKKKKYNPTGLVYKSKVEALSEGMYITDETPKDAFEIKRARIEKERLANGQDHKLNYKFTKKGENLYQEKRRYRNDKKDEMGYHPKGDKNKVMRYYKKKNNNGINLMSLLRRK